MRALVTLLAALAFLAACEKEEATPRAPTTPVATTAPVDPGSGPETTVRAADPPTTTSAPPTTTLPPLRRLVYEQVAGGLPFPTFLTARPGEGTSYLLTKDGRVWELGQGDPSVVMDLSPRVRDRGEQGMLGMALHPDEEDRVFLHYSSADGGDTVLAEYRFAPDRTIDPATERVLLRLDQPAANHNGGMVQFGPDGGLYLGLGDGGGAGDRFGNAQDTGTLLGGIVRVDVDSGEASLWAHGLRNPWRFWIDEPEGMLYVADVGQNAYEEIDVVPFEPAGYDFGWPITEGLHCFSPQQECETEGMTLPVLEVAHGDGGTCSITGGVVVRGGSIPELEGHFLYSDYCGGYLRSFRWDGAGVVHQMDWTEQVGVAGQVTSFGVDGAGEVHVLTTDAVLRLTAVREPEG